MFSHIFVAVQLEWEQMPLPLLPLWKLMYNKGIE